MKNTIFALGLLLIGGNAISQNQPDSIHIVLHENQNGTIRVLDTIVPVSQQQSLFQWMEQNGWDAPPPPPAPGEGPAEFEHVIIIEGDSMQSHHGPHAQRHVMIMHGDCDSMLHPIPPGAKMKMKHGEAHRDADGNMMIMRHPMPPHPPGAAVKVDVQHKDTLIDGKKHSIIIRTERIILPEGVEPPAIPPVPPTPPQAPKIPAAPQKSKETSPAEHQKELTVYPNPTSAVINVEFDVNAKEKTVLRVVDMNGKIIYTEDIVESESKHIKREINLGGSTKGAYTVELKSGKKVIAERVILQ